MLLALIRPHGRATSRADSAVVTGLDQFHVRTLITELPAFDGFLSSSYINVADSQLVTFSVEMIEWGLFPAMPMGQGERIL